MLIYNDQKHSVNEQNEELYTTFIPEDNFWRKVNKKVDFSFVRELACDGFTETNSKNDAIRMFKMLLLKEYYEFSDEELLEKLYTNLTFKFFLECNPLDSVIVDKSKFVLFQNYRVDGNNEYIDTLFKKAIGKPDLIMSMKDIENSSEYTGDNFTMQKVAIVFLSNLKSIK